MSEPTTHAVNAPGATIYYDVRTAEGQNGAPPLMMIGSPMDAAGFTTLAGHFPDRTVVTYDPRGAARSKRTDGAEQTNPEEHADDLHRVIEALGSGPVDLFASSGGAVNALALVARHPEDVRTLVAHEPPAARELPDAEEAMAATTDIHATYLRDGVGPAMAKFIVLVSLGGTIPAGFADQPAPDPAQFGLPIEDDGRRDDALVGQNIVSGTHYEHDFDSLRAASTRIIIAAGAESEGELAHRAALAVAERLGTEPVIFPSNHGGFLGGEYGQTGDPDAFAVKLREVLGQ
jgi:pimeloyl-ACP methyl ester carboxylesterase